MKRTFPACLALIAIVSGTSCNSNGDKMTGPSPTRILVDSGSISLHQNIDSNIADIQFIPLQSSNDAIIGNIQKVALLDKKIILLDRNGQNAVYVFNSDGSLSKVLKSPDGNHISDFIAEGHKIFVFMEAKRRIEVFNETGDHIGTEPTHPDLLANSFERITDRFYAFWNNNASTSIGNYRLLAFDDHQDLKEGFLPFSYAVTRNVNPVNSLPFNRFSDGTICVSQPLNDTIWRLGVQDEHVLLYPRFLLQFQKNPLPRGFINDAVNYNFLQIADNNNHSYYLKNFMDLDSLVSFTYVSAHSHYQFLWDKRRRKSVANAEELGLEKWDITLPTNMQQVDKNTAIGYYHAYDLIAWAQSHKGLKSAAGLLDICAHLSDLDNPVLVSIQYK
jgi:hypothetical protein